MTELNPDQKYLVEEFYEDYRAGRLSRRSFIRMNVYPGVNHAFHNDTGGRYVQEQATQAWRDTLAWFETHL